MWKRLAKTVSSSQQKTKQRNTHPLVPKLLDPREARLLVVLVPLRQRGGRHQVAPAPPPPADRPAALPRQAATPAAAADAAAPPTPPGGGRAERRVLFLVLALRFAAAACITREQTKQRLLGRRIKNAIAMGNKHLNAGAYPSVSFTQTNDLLNIVQINPVNLQPFRGRAYSIQTVQVRRFSLTLCSK